MKYTKQVKHRAVLLVATMVLLAVIATQMRADTGICNGGSITLPFTDVSSSNAYFCTIAAAYFSGLTDGTSATTYNPSQNVRRDVAADFASRTLDQSLRRGSRRAALKQWWTPVVIPSTAKTPLSENPIAVESDGADLWVAQQNGKVSRVRASDGKLLGTWTGATGASAIVVARGRIFIAGYTIPGRIYSIDPTQPPGAVTLVTEQLGIAPVSIAYDGLRIWTANEGSSISIYNFSCVSGTCAKTVTGFGQLSGILYDGSHIWVVDFIDGALKQLNASGTVIFSLAIDGIGFPTFDGTNIWVPTYSNTVAVVRVKDATGNPLSQPFVIATLTGNGLDRPYSVAFDGQRILVTNYLSDSISLWKANDLTPLGTISTGAGSGPIAACSDGINFWIALHAEQRLARY
jgi:hypothetical protein